ncbi:MAG: DNA/RNA nuclease SfsA [Myxococcota bacterium]
MRASEPRSARVALPPLFEARLVRRYKRFFAEVRHAATGELTTAHCPNPGSMLGLLEPDARVRCSTSADPKRKLPHTLEMIEIDRTWVGLHTGRTNSLARAALEAGLVAELRGYRVLRAEAVAEPGSRLDFTLAQHARGEPDAWLEVKSVTLSRQRGLAEFPDAETKRGLKHVELLARLAKRGARAVLLFVVQRGDCDIVAPADDIDIAYGRALREAAAQGVLVRALGARVNAREIAIVRELPVIL